MAGLIMQNTNHDYDEYINPILNDESIWLDSSNFRQARKRLYSSLRLKGYNNDYIEDVMAELFTRWEPLYREYKKNSIVEG